VVAGGTAWLLAISLSRVGAFMIYIAFAATLPVLQREWHLSGTAAALEIPVPSAPASGA
jgi:hypothetical protein